MANNWVINASPLILLVKVGYEKLLLDLAEQAVVPRAVALEIEAGPDDDSARRALSAEKFAIVEVAPPAELLAWDLGTGETAVIAYASQHEGWTAVLDDLAARKCAAAFDVSVKGTLSVVILAKQRGLIDSAADVIREMMGAGYYVDAELVSRALIDTVGEEWTA